MPPRQHNPAMVHFRRRRAHTLQHCRSLAFNQRAAARGAPVRFRCLSHHCMTLRANPLHVRIIPPSLAPSLVHSPWSSRSPHRSPATLESCTPPFASSPSTWMAPSCPPSLKPSARATFAPCAPSRKPESPLPSLPAVAPPTRFRCSKTSACERTHPSLRPMEQ